MTKIKQWFRNRPEQDHRQRIAQLERRDRVITRRIDKLEEYRTGHPIGDILERRQSWNAEQDRD